MSALTKFTIWTRPNCTYCTQAKVLLDRKGLSYEVIEVTSENLKKFQEDTDNAKTVPQIFYTEGDHTRLVGGYDQLSKFVEQWWPDLDG